VRRCAAVVWLGLRCDPDIAPQSLIGGPSKIAVLVKLHNRTPMTLPLLPLWQGGKDLAMDSNRQALVNPYAPVVPTTARGQACLFNFPLASVP
jgi:hypothetical protein